MPQGLQAWDASAGLILDTSQDVGRVLGAISVSANSNSYQDITGINSGETLWVALLSVGALGVNQTWVTTNSRVNWDVVNAGTILYGVY